MESEHDGIRSEHMSARVAAGTYCTILLMIDTQLQSRHQINTDIYFHCICFERVYIVLSV